MQEPDGSVRIAWTGNDHTSIKVAAPRREWEELSAFARDVADVALLNRDLPALHAALRSRFGATFELETRAEPDAREEEQTGEFVLVTLHPPQGMPNPD